MTKEFYFTENCFVCGRNNKHGLNYKIERTPDKAVLNCVLEKKYESFEGVVHGGMVSLLIDEVLWYAFYFKGLTTVTKKLEINFLKPLLIGESVSCKGWVEKPISDETYEGRAQIENSEGHIIATARGEFVVKEELKNKILVLFNKT